MMLGRLSQYYAGDVKLDPRSQISTAEAMLHTVTSGDGVIEHYERALWQLSSLLHPGNYLVLEVKQKLALLYGNIFPYTINRYELKNFLIFVGFIFRKLKCNILGWEDPAESAKYSCVMMSCSDCQDWSQESQRRG